MLLHGHSHVKRISNYFSWTGKSFVVYMGLGLCLIVWCTALPNTLLEQRSGPFNSEASKVTMNVDVWIMVQVSMLKGLANPMEIILTGKFFTTGMEIQCMCKSCKIFHTLVSMRQKITSSLSSSWPLTSDLDLWDCSMSWSLSSSSPSSVSWERHNVVLRLGRWCKYYWFWRKQWKNNSPVSCCKLSLAFHSLIFVWLP